MRKIQLTIIFLIFIARLFAQNARDYSQYYFKNFPNSPSTATFLRYGDIQNSEFIGANSPKIPLYTIKNGAIELPLNLDYIAGNGVKVADEAGSVGLGWNIGIPTITQSVMGYDDFDSDGNYVNLKIDLHYQQAPWAALNYDGKYLESKEINEPAGYIDIPQKGKYAYYYSSHYNLPVNGIFKQFPNWVQYDPSPDIFTINLFGDKIQFIIENHKDLNSSGVLPQFVCLNKHGYKITYNNSQFNITAPNGFIYEFGRSENISMAGLISRNYVLTKITDTNNNYITLSYDEYSNILNFTPFSRNLNYTYWYRADPPYPQCAGIPVYYNGIYAASSKYNANPSSGSTFPYSGNQPAGSFSIPLNYNYQSSQNYLLINEIKGNFGSVKFSYDNRDDFPTKQLSTINIYATDNLKNLKSIAFNYDYFISPNNIYQNATTSYSDNRLKKRLKLVSVVFNQAEQYKFEYYEKYPLPAKDSFAADYWGYFNGGLNNRTYFLNPNDFDLSAYNVPVIDAYNNNKKIADISYCTSGILSRIIYPTKGYSIFEYELNSSENLFQSAYSPKPKEGKGLRFKRQSNYDINNNIVNKTEFTYDGGISTNPLDLLKRYYYKHFDATGEYLYALISMNSTNNYSASPLASGDYIGYSKVTKKEIDNTGNNKGITITNYSIAPDLYYRYDDDQLPVNIPSTKDSGFDNGVVLQQTVLNKNNDTLKVVKNQYTNNFSSIYYGSTLSMLNENLYVCSTISGATVPRPDPDWLVDLSVVAHFPIFHKESLLSSSITTDYFGDKKLATNINYSYNSNNLLNYKSSLTPSSDQISESYSFSSQIPRFIQANILSENTGRNIVKNGKQILNQFTKYDDLNNFNPTSQITSDLNNSNNNTEVMFDKYDDKGNLLQYTTKDGVPVTIIWGYKKTLPIAKIIGAMYPSNNGSPNTIPQNLIDTIVEASDKDNNPPQYNLTYEQSEQLLKESLITFKNNPQLLNYQITGYTYDPLIGVTNIISPNGLLEKYSYDSMGRLISVVDKDNNILKEYKYNYNINNPSSVFYSNYLEQAFTRNNCGSNYIGGVYVYSVPANKYLSLISQGDADNKATAEAIGNGQLMANQYGSCTPVIPCNFAKNTSLNISNTNFNSTGNLVHGYIVINSPTINWNQETHLGYIQDICIPSSLKTLNNNVEAGHDAIYRQWDIKIYPSGQITAKLTYGSVSSTPNIPIILDFTYNKN